MFASSFARSSLALLPGLAAVQVVAQEKSVALEPFVVRSSSAGQFTTGSSPSAILKPMEILMVPGSAADINRALQTLPGVQAADEGNALFVRGGDSRETATWINGIRFPGSPQLNAPLGSSSGTISPMQAASVEFMAGGFGASTGDVLSGAVKIKTAGAPKTRNAMLNLGMGNQAASLSWPWAENAGMTITAGRTDLEPFFKAFTPTRSYLKAPYGSDVSVAGSWDYRRGGRVTWYGISQRSGVALEINDLARTGVYRSDGDLNFGVLSWSDHFGSWRHELNAGGGVRTRMSSSQRIAGARRSEAGGFRLSVPMMRAVRSGGWARMSGEKMRRSHGRRRQTLLEVMRMSWKRFRVDLRKSSSRRGRSLRRCCGGS